MIGRTHKPKRVAILHAGPRPFDVGLGVRLQQMGMECELHDVTLTSTEASIDEGSLVLNRVYPSDVFERGEDVVGQTLALLARCEARTIETLNSLTAARADYSKLESSLLMRARGVRTPDTTRLHVDMPTGAPFLPAVVKLDTGGFSKDACLIETDESWKQFLDSSDWRTRTRIVQPFVRATEAADYRVTVLFGKVVSAYKRSLVDGWIGSLERGAKRTVLEKCPEELSAIALAASSSISAQINGVDIMVDSQGPIVIENNPTPAFAHGQDPASNFDPIAAIATAIQEWVNR